MDDAESSTDSEIKVQLPNRKFQELLYANSDRIIHHIERETGLQIAGRDSYLTLRGDPPKLEEGRRIIDNLLSVYLEKNRIGDQELSLIISRIRKNLSYRADAYKDKQIPIGANGKIITPKSAGQARYFDAIKKNDVVFAIGPAGTGKTYLAMAFALNYLMSENISRIILTRPVVEAGESLGYLPGDLEQKVNPYLRPLYDAIYDMIPYIVFQRYVEKGAIEVAPLAYMRGRTLHDSFIILDEAQNTTRGQMLMFLTRLGFNSKTIVTGDVTQSDLPRERSSGLHNAVKVLKHVDGISFIHLGPEDVVRHPLVERIIHAFKDHEDKEK
jgi:phosphate starvation-inducible PhoH-like protein